MNDFLFLLFFFGSFAGASQSFVVEIATDNKPNEVSICIDHTNPERILAGANIANLYLSEDGGLTWTARTQKSPYGVWGDPVIIQDTLGSFYHFHLSRVSEGNFIDRLVCQRSDDGGKTFNDGTYFGLNGSKAQDKPWAVVNSATNEIYVTWTQFDKYDSKDPEDRSNILFSKSADRGETWSTPVKVNTVDGNCRDDDDTVEGAVPAVGPNGEIYVAWSGPNGLVFNRSFDGGSTWEVKEISIADHVGGWNIDIPGIYRANGMPVTKCDLSGGPNHGTIYVNWADQRNGTSNTDIFLSHSKDKGQSWSLPVKVNQDTTQNHQFFTWMDIDQTNGNIWFVYHDRRHHSDSGTDVYAAVSEDGGHTFGEIQLNQQPFYPDSSVFFGDYNTIAAHGNMVRPAWTRLDQQQLSIKTSILDTYSILDRGASLVISTGPRGGIKVAGVPKGEVSVTVRNLMKEIVFMQVDLKSDTGRLLIAGASNLKPGVYLLEIDSGMAKSRGQWIKP